jgi:anti-sigma factor RsiW
VTAHPLVPSGPVEPVGPHLSDRISALVDDALPADARDRALVHITGCAPCRLEFESSRLLKARLSVLPAPQVPAGLTARLLAMAEPGGPIPPRPSQLPTQPRALGVPGRPTAARPQGSRPAGRSDRTTTSPRASGASPRRTVRFAALAGAALSTMVVAVVGLSTGAGTETPKPPVSQLTSTVGGATGGAGSTDPMLDVSRVIRRVSGDSTLVGAP